MGCEARFGPSDRDLAVLPRPVRRAFPAIKTPCNPRPQGSIRRVERGQSRGPDRLQKASPGLHGQGRGQRLRPRRSTEPLPPVALESVGRVEKGGNDGRLPGARKPTWSLPGWQDKSVGDVKSSRHSIGAFDPFAYSSSNVHQNTTAQSGGFAVHVETPII
jgi:hypothetical protein